MTPDTAVVCLRYDCSFDENVSAVYLWSEWEQPESRYFSIPKFVEDRADILRTKTFNFIEQMVLETDLVTFDLDYCRVESWWHFFELSEFSNFGKSTWLDQVVKAQGLLEICNKHMVTSLNISQLPRDVQQIVKLVFSESGINLDACGHKTENISELRGQAALVSRCIWASLKNLASSFITRKKVSLANRVVVVSYLEKNSVNLDKVERDVYVDGILKQLLEEGYQVTVLYIYSPSRGLPSLRSAAKYLGRIFESELYPNDRVNFVLLNSYLRPVIYVKRILSGFVLNIFKFHCTSSLNLIKKCTSFYLDLANSSFGPGFASSLYFDSAFSNFWEQFSYVNKDGNCIYLMEGQVWETIMLRLGRKYSEINFQGYCHSSVRYWDMRYFKSQQALERFRFQRLLPDSILVNNHLSYEVMIGNGFEPRELRKVNAFRFQYLLDAISIERKIDKNPEVLVLGEYNKVTTCNLLYLLSSSVLRNFDSIAIKFHPNCSLDPSLFNLNLKIVTEPLSVLLTSYDMVICSNMTTASLECMFLGIPMKVVLDPFALNMSPLRGKPEFFVDDPSSVDEFVESVLNRSLEVYPQDCFYLRESNPLIGSLN